MSAVLLLGDAWDGPHGRLGRRLVDLVVAMMVAFWAVVIVLVVWLVRSLGFGRQRSRRGVSAIELLDQRLARGEISPDEYKERRDALGSGPSR
ncbi:MAG TPA: SHOCT domain-containing protein [Solirubrobacterales bacterium]|nr:SHOCT domain-containing protein [Solirubrobacterales bacterium]